MVLPDVASVSQDVKGYFPCVGVLMDGCKRDAIQLAQYVLVTHALVIGNDQDIFPFCVREDAGRDDECDGLVADVDDIVRDGHGLVLVRVGQAFVDPVRELPLGSDPVGLEELLDDLVLVAAYLEYGF